MARVKTDEVPATDTGTEPDNTLKLAKVINVSAAGGHLTDMQGKRVPPGGSCELPIAICESLVRRGICRFTYPSESGE